jgi:hypothetical protein
MKYYSEKLNKFYDTAVDCEKAEFEAKEKENLEKIKKERELALAKEQKEKALAERKAKAEKVETARKEYMNAQQNYRKELQEFCKAYGTYHYSTNNADEIPSLFDWFNNIFKI